MKENFHMKNTAQRFLSLALALCMSLSLLCVANASNTSDTSGSSASSNVTLSSTEDGSLGGNPAATAMSVTVPTVLPIAVGTDGRVTTATGAEIVNNSYGAVKVSSVSIHAGEGWHLTAFGDASTLAGEKVDSNKVGFAMSIGGSDQLATTNDNESVQNLLASAVEGCYMSGSGDTANTRAAISYDAIVTSVSEAVTNAGVASVLFVIEWDI